MSADQVSVVIPSTGRASLQAAVASVLAQSTPPGEIIVVIDGPTDSAFDQDARVRYIVRDVNAGGNACRNAGIAAATGRFIALLDDDDVWEPEKLEKQVALGATAKSDSWIVSGRTVEPDGTKWPKNIIPPTGSIVDYLFVKRSLRGGQGLLHASTLLMPKSLLARVPLREDLRFHEDTDWLVRVDELRPRIEVLQVPEVIVRVGHGSDSTSGKISAEQSRKWAMASLPRGRARSDFLLTVSYVFAWRRRHMRAAFLCVCSAFARSRPTAYGATSIVVIPAKHLIAWVRHRRR